jgi:cell division protein FtsB
MKTIISILTLLLAVLQYQLWVGTGSIADVWRLNQSIETQTRDNAALRERNQALDADVRDFKQGLDSVESSARSELGMVQEGETFFQVVEEKRSP